jgi:hypothetical protein
MKKILYSLTLLFFILFPINVYAYGYINATPNTLTIEQGSSKTFTITAFNAIGDVEIKSNNNAIASVNTGSWGTGMVGEKETKTGTVTVTGSAIGTTTIALTLDAATFDGEDLAGQTTTVTVNVVAKSAPKPSKPQTQKPAEQPTILSKNNNIKSITIEGYEIEKLDDNNYTLTVSNNVTDITINAEAEDEKATVEGIGQYNLNIGENKIEITITSESGDKNIINVNITRKDGYYLSDLEEILNNKNITDADIIIDSDSIVTKEQIEKIKNSKKTIRLNYFDENKKLIYSWIINGEFIKETAELNTSISYTAENTKEIYELSNYADGLYVSFKHNGNLPKPIKVKIYVGNRFENRDIVKVYNFNNKEKSLELIKDNLKVAEGYIEFEVESYEELFITKANISNATIKLNDNESSFTKLFIITTIISVIINIILFIFISQKLKAKNN